MVTITQNEFRQISDYIKVNYGIYIKEEKQALLTVRLQSVMLKAGFDNFTDYYHYVLADKTRNALITFVDQITTNHTFFMREADHFFYFRDTVLPYLTRQSAGNKDLRIWCAACSSGEEPYTLAMVLDEFLGMEKASWDSKILATDISSRVLDTARSGIYSKDRIAPLPSYWRMNYFQQMDAQNYAVVDRIKNEVIFRKFNLMEPSFPFKKKFQVIFCRNVMIYFDKETREQLVDKMYDLMEDGGYLFIGHSETLNKDSTRFKYIKPAVYRKTVG